MGERTLEGAFGQGLVLGTVLPEKGQINTGAALPRTPLHGPCQESAGIIPPPAIRLTSSVKAPHKLNRPSDGANTKQKRLASL